MLFFVFGFWFIVSVYRSRRPNRKHTQCPVRLLKLPLLLLLFLLYQMVVVGRDDILVTNYFIYHWWNVFLFIAIPCLFFSSFKFVFRFCFFFLSFLPSLTISGKKCRYIWHLFHCMLLRRLKYASNAENVDRMLCNVGVAVSSIVCVIWIKCNLVWLRVIRRLHNIAHRHHRDKNSYCSDTIYRGDRQLPNIFILLFSPN